VKTTVTTENKTAGSAGNRIPIRKPGVNTTLVKIIAESARRAG
jgi:hypothetical protein